MKLQLFISHNGGISRRKAFDHILAGDVTVNGNAVREPSHMMDPGEDKITLEGREIKLKDYEYIMLNKPVGYVTTCETQFDQWGVLALLPPNLRHLKPVGRLDKDTQGLLFLTNDGELAHRLAHPSFDVNKTYHVRVVRRLEFREKDRLEKGVVIEKFKTAPAEVGNVVFDGNFTEFDLTIHEGHKHQVRLMCHEVGHDVVRLTRIAQGPLRLDALKSGAWRPLTMEEQASLHAIGRVARTLKPVFSSHSSDRRYSANRDWKSGQPSSAGSGRTEARPARPYTSSPRGSSDRPSYSSTPRVANDRSSYSSRPRMAGESSYRSKPQTGSDRPYAPRTDEKGVSTSRPAGERLARPESGEKRSFRPRPTGDRPYSSRPRTGSDKPYAARTDEKRAYAPRPAGAVFSRPDGQRALTPRPRSDKPYGHKTYSGKSSPARRAGRS
ncbi:MAG: pseudouridine synthase [Candidatus Omnitrophota bacterium]